MHIPRVLELLLTGQLLSSMPWTSFLLLSIKFSKYWLRGSIWTSENHQRRGRRSSTATVPLTPSQSDSYLPAREETPPTPKKKKKRKKLRNIRPRTERAVSNDLVQDTKLLAPPKWVLHQEWFESPIIGWFYSAEFASKQRGSDWDILERYSTFAHENYFCGVPAVVQRIKD